MPRHVSKRSKRVSKPSSNSKEDAIAHPPIKFERANSPTRYSLRPLAESAGNKPNRKDLRTDRPKYSKYDFSKVNALRILSEYGYFLIPRTPSSGPTLKVKKKKKA